ncbi:single-stranded DNA-binding protein [Candidatus Parcubacteria bacterium]|nr:single-stranded DNA-binding protein [Candidatus Parcubacteria bacterium]
MNLNKVFLIGRLTKDPEKKILPSGQVVCSFGLATDRFWVDKDGKKQQETEFHNIVLFGKLAEIASQYLKKGKLVFIEGRLKTRTWEDNSGQKKQKTEIVVERMQLGPRVKKEELPIVEEEEKKLSKEEIPVIEEEIDLEDIPF